MNASCRWGVLALWGAIASPGLAQDICPTLDSIPKARLSVAWVSPLGVKAGPRRWIPVVQTAQLRDAISTDDADLARMLQLLGERRRSTRPKRRYKVVVFEVAPEYLCRPLVDTEAGMVVDGQPSCPPRFGKTSRRYSGCGFTTDLSDDSRGLDLYRVQWRDVAQSGFCVLPAERFVQGE